MQTPQELLDELAGIADPPDVSGLLGGSGVIDTFSTLRCSAVDCGVLASSLAQLQQWLSQARAKLSELQAYLTQSDLQRIRGEAELGQRDAEREVGDDESENSGYQDVINEVNERLLETDSRYTQLADQRMIENGIKQALQAVQNHCCVEASWWQQYSPF